MDRVPGIVECIRTRGIPSLRKATRWRDEFPVAPLVDGVVYVRRPIDVVCLHIGKAHDVVGGVVVGRPRGHAMLPDVLLGFVSNDDGSWYWAGRDAGHVINIHAIATDDVVDMPTASSWPVWFVFADACGERESLSRLPVDIDVYDDARRHLRTRFWSCTMEEFVRQTWAPSRAPSWCFEYDDEYFLSAR